MDMDMDIMATGIIMAGKFLVLNLGLKKMNIFLYRGVDRTQCNQAQQLFNQWWPQSQLSSAFQTVCAQFGATQAWALLQNQLGVPVTGEECILNLYFSIRLHLGTLDQTTFQALLNNANHALLAQQLLLSMG